MKNKGFTLIELLAVIVILAIIALIAVPMILGVIDKARKGSAESSALGYLDAVEKYMIMHELNSTEYPYELKTGETYYVNSNSEISFLDLIVEKVNAADFYLNSIISVKGEKPTSGSVVIGEKHTVASANLVIKGYSITCDTNKCTAGNKSSNNQSENDNNGEDNNNNNNPTISSGPTYVAPQTGETHLGIVYLDPTDLTTDCSVNDTTVGSGISGCMKWYIYNDDGTNYKMILDHNTENGVVWNSSNKNVSYSSSKAYTSIQNLVTNNNWDSSLNTTLITTSEINTITEKTGFDASSTGSWYYFDDPNKDQTQTASSQGASSYAWLYDYTNSCTTFGCNMADSNTSGYWTQDTVGSARSGSSIWLIYKSGSLALRDANDTYYGVRPVITVSKSIINN